MIWREFTERLGGARQWVGLGAIGCERPSCAYYTSPCPTTLFILCYLIHADPHRKLTHRLDEARVLSHA